MEHLQNIVRVFARAGIQQGICRVISDGGSPQGDPKLDIFVAGSNLNSFCIQSEPDFENSRISNQIAFVIAKVKHTSIFASEHKPPPLEILKEVTLDKIHATFNLNYGDLREAERVALKNLYLRKYSNNNPTYQRELNISLSFKYDELKENRVGTVSLDVIEWSGTLLGIRAIYKQDTKDESTKLILFEDEPSSLEKNGYILRFLKNNGFDMIQNSKLFGKRWEHNHIVYLEGLIA